jgi:hypothetical protein
LANHLIQPEVLELHIGIAAQNTLGVMVNCTKLADYSMQSLYRAMLESLVKAVRERTSFANELVRQLESMWSVAVETSSPERIRQTLEGAVDAITHLGIHRIIMVFDDFDSVVEKVPAEALKGLRALRDDFRTQLMYVTVTRRELAFIRPEREIHDLLEIVASTTIPIGPYRQTDADFMIERLSHRQELKPVLTDAERLLMVELSGGHAGLLKALISARREGMTLTSTQSPISELSGYGNIQAECATIHDSLEKREWNALIEVSQGHELDHTDLHRLQRKGLVRPRSENEVEIFSPLFADFIHRQHVRGQIEAILERVSRETHHVVLFRLFACLREWGGQNVSQRQIFDVMIAAEKEQATHAPGSPLNRLNLYLAELKRIVDAVFGRECLIAESDGSYRLILPRTR